MQRQKLIFSGLLALSASLFATPGLAAPAPAPDDLNDDEKRFVVCAAATSLQGHQLHQRWAEHGALQLKDPVKDPAKDSAATTPSTKEAVVGTARAFWHYTQTLQDRLGHERTTQELSKQKQALQRRLQDQSFKPDNLQELSDACKRLSDSWEARGLVSEEQVEQAKSFALLAWKQAKSTPLSLPATQGTAFVVAPGHLLTNAHVVRGARRITLVSPDGTRHDAQWMANAPDADLALLRAPVDAAPLPLAFGSEPEMGQEVFALGHPLVDTLGFTQKAAFGRVSAVPVTGTALFQADLQVQPGFSGGPLLDEKGQVLGVVTSTVNQRETLASRGVTASNVAFSSRMSWAKPWLQAQLPEHSWTEASAAKTSKTPAPLTDVIRRTQPSVFLVEALR